VIGGTNGQGVVFSLTPSGTETVLYSFCSTISNGICLDGKAPEASWLRLAPAISTGQQRKAEQ
jgi:uncharacterized repeat protein (TIGR03803 family)